MTERGWAWVGKVALVVGALYSAVMLYKALTDPTPPLCVLEGGIRVQPLIVPPLLDKEARQLTEFFNGLPKPNEVSAEDESLLSELLALKEKLPFMVSRKPSIGASWLVTIGNEGTGTCESVALEVPGATHITLLKTPPGPPGDFDEVGDVIEFGDLRPQERAGAVVWTDQAYSEQLVLSSLDIKLIHKDGVGDMMALNSNVVVDRLGRSVRQISYGLIALAVLSVIQLVMRTRRGSSIQKDSAVGAESVDPEPKEKAKP